MIKTESKDTFWKVVKECLVKFHQFSPHEAQKKMMELRERIEKPPAGLSSDIIYHSEPYYIACNIAKNERDILADRKEYDKILKEYHW